MMLQVFRIGLHVFHGRGICAGLSGRQSYLYQRTCEWLVRTDSFRHQQLSDRVAVLV